MAAPQWNPSDPAFRADPYPFYARLRAEDPLHITPFGHLVLTRYDDVAQVLRDPTTTMKGRVDRDSPSGERRPGNAPSLLGEDPPDHTRLRRLLSKVLLPRAARLRPLIVSIVDALLDDLRGRDEVDLITDYAYSIPSTITHTMLGLPNRDLLRTRGWMNDLIRRIEPFQTAEEEALCAIAVSEMDDYLTSAISEKLNTPTDDLLTDLVRIEEEGDKLGNDELLPMIQLLFIAGHETNVHMIGNAIHSLLDNPEQKALVVQGNVNPTVMVDELLRYDSPAQTSARRLTKDTVIGGQEFPAEQRIFVSLGSANRDQSFWGDTADDLDLTRGDAVRHFAFGGGVHHCLGAPLGRMEGEVAITRFVQEFPKAELAGDPTFSSRMVVRGRETFPIRLGV